MEFDKTRSSCSWNSDQNCTQNSARGSRGPGGWVSGYRGRRGPRGCSWMLVGGLFDMKITLSV